MFITKKHISASDGSSRHGSRRGAAVSRNRWFLRRRLCSKTAAMPQSRLTCIEIVSRLGRQHGVRYRKQPVDAGERRFAISSSRSILEAAGAVPRLHDDRQPHGLRDRPMPCRRGRSRRRPLPLERRVSDGGACEADRGIRHLQRHVDRSAVRAEVRSGHAAAFDSAVHRESGFVGLVRLQLQLRLHGYDQLVFADHAAADDAQSARGLRRAVRYRRLAAGSRQPQARSIAVFSTESSTTSPGCSSNLDPRDRRPA